jgi:hypothetical protein
MQGGERKQKWRTVKCVYIAQVIKIVIRENVLMGGAKSFYT